MEEINIGDLVRMTEKIKEQLNKSFGYTGEVFMYLVEHYY